MFSFQILSYAKNAGFENEIHQAALQRWVWRDPHTRSTWNRWGSPPWSSCSLAGCNCMSGSTGETQHSRRSEGSRINWSLGLFLRNSLVNVVWFLPNSKKFRSSKMAWRKIKTSISLKFPIYFPCISLFTTKTTVENHEGEDREQEDGEGVLRPPPGSTRQVSPGVANHRRYTSLGVSSAATRSIWQGEAGTLLRPHAARKNGRLTKSGCNLYDTSSRCSFLCDSQVSQLGWFGSSDLTAAV